MKENSIEEDVKILEKFIKYYEAEATSRKFRGTLSISVDEDEIDALENLINMYKRVLKENEEKTTILLEGAEKVKQLEEENKELKTQIPNVKNGTYIGDYQGLLKLEKEIVERENIIEQLQVKVNSLKEENKNIKADNYELNNRITDLLENIPIQKVKDKIRKNEEIIDITNDGDLIHELYQENKVYEELLEKEQ